MAVERKGKQRNTGRRNSGKTTPRRRAEPSGTPGGLEAVFGVHAVRALLERGETPQVVWIQQGEAQQRLAGLMDAAQGGGARIEPRPRDDLDRLAREVAHQGIIAFAAPLAFESEAALWFKLEAWPHPTPPLLLVLDGVTDVHNFGACLRSAEAAGVHGVIVTKDKAAPLNATVRKVACGAAESLPVYQVTNLARALARLKEYGVWITGTAGEADTLLFDADFSQPCAIVMGAEGKGMRRLTREACDSLVKLPMAGSVSSLNVSVATGICLFEVVRQRRDSNA